MREQWTVHDTDKLQKGVRASIYQLVLIKKSFFCNVFIRNTEVVLSKKGKLISKCFEKKQVKTLTYNI